MEDARLRSAAWAWSDSLVSDDRVGTTLAGYEITAELGRGGMGVVYVARHEHLGREVALRLLSPEIADQPKLRERFIRESRLLAGLEHPNIVTVYDAGEDEGDLYIAMRLIRGTDLATVLAEKGQLPPGAAAKILISVAKALDEAHAAGLVHRDVKPANVFVEVEERRISNVWLGDFGLTKGTGSGSAMTKAGAIVGTVAYMAPEQFEGREMDGRTDQYSLGCLFYECVTGHPPFEREHDAAVKLAHLNDDPPRLSDAVHNLPDGIDHAVARAMAKDPADRYPTCGDLADHVRSLFRGRPTGSAPVRKRAPKEPAERSLMRRFGPLAAVAALALIGAGILVSLGGPDDPATGVDATSDKRVLFIGEEDGRPYWIRAVEAVEPEELSGSFDALTGTDVEVQGAPIEDGWLSAGENGTIVMATQRFGCEAWPCLVWIAPDLQSGDVMRAAGEELHSDGLGDVGPDGRTVVYEGGDGPNESDLVVTTRQGEEWTEPVVLTGDSEHSYNARPSISPDGTRVVFECGPRQYQAEGTGVCEVGIDGHGYRTLIRPQDGPDATEQDILKHPDITAAGGVVFGANWRGEDRVWLWKDAEITAIGDVDSVGPCAFADGRVAFGVGGWPWSKLRIQGVDGSNPIDLDVPQPDASYFRCAG